MTELKIEPVIICSIILEKYLIRSIKKLPLSDSKVSFAANVDMPVAIGPILPVTLVVVEFLSTNNNSETVGTSAAVELEIRICSDIVEIYIIAAWCCHDILVPHP